MAKSNKISIDYRSSTRSSVSISRPFGKLLGGDNILTADRGNPTAKNLPTLKTFKKINNFKSTVREKTEASEQKTLITLFKKSVLS